MQCKTQGFTPISLIGLALTLSACASEAEEAPDITEAIPLDIEEEGEANAAAGDNAPALPDAPGESARADGAAGERNLPDTMETGRNPPDFEPPEGSKIQPIK